jgi:hypothetical protein
MDDLISSFNGSSLGGGVQKLSGTEMVYISEVSSPTKVNKEGNKIFNIKLILITVLDSFGSWENRSAHAGHDVSA